ncbi:MAG: hypothetical protein ACI8R4_001152 [Paracoccaceae bacterium]|jgi:hypothetical protein
MPGLALAGCTIGAKHLFQLSQPVGVIGKMRECLVARRFAGFQFGLHCGAVIAVERIVFDADRLVTFAPEDLVEGGFDGGCSRAGRSGDRDDGTFLARWKTLNL